MILLWALACVQPASDAPPVASLGDTAAAKMATIAVNEQVPQLYPCYHDALARRPDLQGTWVVRFEVVPSGGVRRLSVRGEEMHDAGLEACIFTRVLHWQFDKVDAALPITKSVTFP